MLGCCVVTGLSGMDGQTYSMGIMPDIQYYYNNYLPGNYAKLLSQIRWLALNAEAENLRVLLQLGDITQNDNNDVQWTGARAAFDALNGVCPYVLALGNHDGRNDGRISYFTKPAYFGSGSPYASQASVGGSMETDNLANSFHFIETGERTWMIVTLEWAPRDSTLIWLEQLLSQYPQYRTIVITHAYLYRDNSRLDGVLLGSDMRGSNPKSYPLVAGDPEGCNDGQDIWRKVLRKHPQVALVYSGHVGSNGGIGRRQSIGTARQLVHERLTDFQSWTGEGNGWMQVIKLSADGNLAHVRSFSPFIDSNNTDPDLDYIFPFLEDVLPAGGRAALGELLPDYHFELRDWSAARPVRNRSANKNGYCLMATKTEGACHIIKPGDLVYGRLPMNSPQWTLATWVRFDKDALSSAAALPAVQLGSLELVATPTGSGKVLTLREAGLPLVTDSVNLLPERWYFIALVQGTDAICLYLDGELLGAVEGVAPMSEVEQLFLGASTFSGQIHQLSYFERPLSMGDVERLRLAYFTQVQAGQIAVGQATASWEMSLPGLGTYAQAEGRLNIARTERSYLRYGSDGVFEKYLSMDDPLQYSDGVLLASVMAAPGENYLPSVGVDRVHKEVNKVLSLGPRPGFSLVVQNTGGQAGIPVSAPVSYAFFPICAGFASGHVGAAGTLIEENVIGPSSAAPSGVQGSIIVSSPALDAREGLLFACAGNAAPVVVNTGYDNAGNAYLFPLTTYMDRSTQSALHPCSFVFIPFDTENLTGGLYDGTTGTELKNIGGAKVERESFGTYKITLGHGATPATLLLSSVDTNANGAYAESADNCLSYEELAPGTYRVHCLDLPGRTPEDTVIAWAVVPDKDAFEDSSTELDAADANLIEFLPDADLIHSQWHLSYSWGWAYAREWPWVWVNGKGWVYFHPIEQAGCSWIYQLDTDEWFGINPACWPYLYSPLRGWIDGLPSQ